MQKSVLFVTFCSLLLLAGCNMNDNARNDETPMQDVERGVNDAVDDTRDAIDDTIDPDVRNNQNGQLNESTIDNNQNPNVNVPNGSSGPNGENGLTAPGAPSVNQEDIIEDRADRKDQDKIDNH